MIQTIKIENIGKYINCVFSLNKEEAQSSSYTDYIFRGQRNYEYELNSSLRRTYKNQFAYAEKRLLQNFQKYSSIYDSHTNDSIWHNMIIAQHHGIPTRFLDFSSSPMVALHFALTDNNPTEDAVVWAVNLTTVHSKLLPDNYKKILSDYGSFAFTVDMLQEMNLSIEQYNKDMEDKHFLVIEPPSIDQRIINQGSLLALLPDALDPLDKFFQNNSHEGIAYKLLIPKEKTYLFRMQLDEMNINERTLFGDLDSIAKYLSRRYKKEIDFNW